MLELTERQKKVNAEALRFLHGHTPLGFSAQDSEKFWFEVQEEIKRISGRRVGGIPDWYKSGYEWGW